MSKQIEQKCGNCENLFLCEYKYISRADRTGRTLYCSRKCSYIGSKVDRINKNCLVCNQEIVTTHTENKKFCSSSCSAKVSNKKRAKPHKDCLYCGVRTNTLHTKYCSGVCSAKYRAEANIKNGTAKSQSLKKYLLLVYGHSCWKCRLTTWNDLPIPLDLEHTDGNSENNNLNNLELLCCNCHAQTPTYKNKNKGNGRYSRRKRYEEGLSY